MFRKGFLVVLLLILNNKMIMAQSIGLDELVEFHEKQDPSFISSFLKGEGEWISEYENFEDNRGSYKWYKSSIEEELEPNSKDELSYKSREGFNSAIVYMTLERSNFDKIVSSISLGFNMDELLVDDPKFKMYKYSDENLVIEVGEPFVPQNGAKFLYFFIVYNKSDYQNGYKIR